MPKFSSHFPPFLLWGAAFLPYMDHIPRHSLCPTPDLFEMPEIAARSYFKGLTAECAEPHRSPCVAVAPAFQLAGPCWHSRLKVSGGLGDGQLLMYCFTPNSSESCGVLVMFPILSLIQNHQQYLCTSTDRLAPEEIRAMANFSSTNSTLKYSSGFES